MPVIERRATVALADLEELFRRAFGQRMPIDLTDEELALVDRIRTAMRDA